MDWLVKRKKKKSKPSVDGIFVEQKRSDNHSQSHYNKDKYQWLLILSLVLILIGSVLCLFSDYFFLAKIFRTGKHLILFQNSAELRPTGGFIGSLAEVKTNNFHIDKLDFDSNIYKRDNAFTRNNQIIPKDEILAEFIPDDGLALRDSNWSADFTKAAEEISWFFENEGGYKLDNLVAINSEFFKDLLDITGPIDMVKYNVHVDSDNFNEVIQKQVEETYYNSQENDSVSEPKSILAEMMPIVIARLKKIDKVDDVLSLILRSLVNKNIQIYSFHPKYEKELKSKNWSGNIKMPTSDYLMINHANLGANKSSIYIDEKINYQINTSNSPIEAQLSIVRFYPNDKSDDANINFTRVYVPLGATIKKAYQNNKDITNDVAIEEEYGKTVFRFWTNVSKGETCDTKIIYDLPQYIQSNSYSLLIQKQSGAINQNLKFTLNDIVKYNGIFNTDIDIKP